MDQSDRATQIHEILQPIGVGDDSAQLITWTQRFGQIFEFQGALIDGKATSP